MPGRAGSAAAAALALADVEEDVGRICSTLWRSLLGAVAPLEHLVLVARELEALLAWSGSAWPWMWKRGRAPFFMRTSDTLVSLIWFDGWFIGILEFVQKWSRSILNPINI